MDVVEANIKIVDEENMPRPFIRFDEEKLPKSPKSWFKNNSDAAGKINLKMKLPDNFLLDVFQTLYPNVSRNSHINKMLSKFTDEQFEPISNMSPSVCMLIGLVADILIGDLNGKPSWTRKAAINGLMYPGYELDVIKYDEFNPEDIGRAQCSEDNNGWVPHPSGSLIDVWQVLKKYLQAKDCYSRVESILKKGLGGEFFAEMDKVN